MAETSLFLLVLLPFAGAIFAAFMKAPAVARTWALLVSFISFALAIIIGVTVTGGERVVWGGETNNPLALPEIGFSFRLACDSISLWMVLLTTFVTPLVIVSVSDEVNERANAGWFFAWVLMLMGALIGTFLAGDGLLFYFFFELTLVPSLLLIAIWGGGERRQAAGKFFIYTFAGSVFLLIALVYLAAKAGSFNLDTLTVAAQTQLTDRERFWVALGLLVGFLIKTPVFPLHTWQPLTYGESPNAAAAIFAGVLSKLGTYGLLRLTLPLGFVGATGNSSLLHLVIILCLIGIVYGGLVAWNQKDMVRLMAYSSLSHLGICVLAIFASSTLSLQGAVMYMIAHGLATAALLLMIGMIHRRVGTRDLTLVSGLFAQMPVLGTLFVLFTLASIGLPITSGFIGEFLSLQGVLNSFGLGITLIAATGMILGAVYMLHMVAMVFFGPVRLTEQTDSRDLNVRELASLLPLAAAVLAVGISPTPVLQSLKTDLASLAGRQANVAEVDSDNAVVSEPEVQLVATDAQP